MSVKEELDDDQFALQQYGKKRKRQWEDMLMEGPSSLDAKPV